MINMDPRSASSCTIGPLYRLALGLKICGPTCEHHCRLAVPAIQRRGGVRRCGLKQYSERNALAVLLALCWRACAMRVAGWYRKTDLTRIVRKRQIWDTYGRTLPTSTTCSVLERRENSALGAYVCLAFHSAGRMRRWDVAALQAVSTVNLLGLRAYVSSSRPFLGVHTAFPYTNIAYRWSLAN